MDKLHQSSESVTATTRVHSRLTVLQLGKTLKIPVIKFLLHSASYLWFLITLLGESITMELYRDVFASRQQNILHSSFHMVWVVGGSSLPRRRSLPLSLCLSTSFSLALSLSVYQDDVWSLRRFCRVLLVRVQGGVDRGAAELLPGLVELPGHDGAEHVPGVLHPASAHHAQGTFPLPGPQLRRGVLVLHPDRYGEPLLIMHTFENVGFIALFLCGKVLWEGVCVCVCVCV